MCKYVKCVNMLSTGRLNISNIQRELGFLKNFLIDLFGVKFIHTSIEFVFSI